MFTIFCLTGLLSYHSHYFNLAFTYLKNIYQILHSYYFEEGTCLNYNAFLKMTLVFKMVYHKLHFQLVCIQLIETFKIFPKINLLLPFLNHFSDKTRVHIYPKHKLSSII
jgi:hypothetical protein